MSMRKDDRARWGRYVIGQPLGDRACSSPEVSFDHEEGEGMSPFNLASLLGFFGEGLGMSSSKHSDDNVKKYAI